MARPDLNSPEGLTVYRQELRGVAKPVRLAAFVLVLVGAAVVVAGVWLDVPGWVTNGGYITLGLGWVAMVAAVFMRTRYHRRRMAEPE